MQKRQDDCQHRMLAHGKRHQISQCSRGTVHVTVANTTLRFRQDEFMALAETAKAAQRALALDVEAPRAHALPN